MKKKGFTLIELLAVIIILAVVALIATPIVLNVVENAKDSTGKSQAYFLLDAAKNYHAESMFDDTKKENINNLNDIYGLIELSNKKPDNGKLYINSEGNTALSVIINKKCYKKELYGELEISKDESCDLGYIGNDTTPPSVDFDVLGDPLNSNGWSNKDFFVKITVVDNESGPLKYNWCSGIENCEPNVTQESSSGNALISLNSDSNIVCVMGYDKAENESEKTCSPLYKLDKVSPLFNGINDIFVNRDDVVDLTSGVNVIDDLSGIDGNYSYSPTSVDTTKAGITEVTYSVSDMAGNVNTITRKVIVDAIAPTVEYKVLGNTINSNGWSKEDFFIEAILTDNSGLGIKTAKWCSTTNDTCEPIADMTNNKITPLINIESNNNRICIKATDNNDKTSEVMCSDSYKLDKTNPVVGTINISGTLGSSDWYTSDVSISGINGSDGLSGHSSTIVDVTSITSNTTGKSVTITTADLAGNTSSSTQIIKVDKTYPTVTTTGSSITIKQGDSNQVSSYFTSSYSISGGTMNCNPVNTSGLEVGTQTVSCTATGGNGLQTTSSKSIIVQSKEFVDTSGANAPQLFNKMIPVAHNGSNWVVVNAIQKEWYSYDQKSWANAVVLKSGVTKNVGQTINIATDVDLMFVWIPRYKYTIFNGNNGSAPVQQINVVFESGTTKTGTVTCTTATSGSGTNSENCSSITNGVSTYTHPAFTFGTKALTGIWVGKYKNGNKNSCNPTISVAGTDCDRTDLGIQIKSGISTWTGARTGTFYTAIKNIASQYGINADSHMMKNMEWGAVTYLTQSKYGYNSDSTTGNVYGIYNMNDQVAEYVMGNMVTPTNEPFVGGSYQYNSNSGFNGLLNAGQVYTGGFPFPESKYYDAYTYSQGYPQGQPSWTIHSRGKLGDATKETLETYGSDSGGWNGCQASMVSGTGPWVIRGYKSWSTGIFSFQFTDGHADPYYASRAVIVSQ